MIINESAIYEGKSWCAYELKDIYGTYREEYRLYMRMESQERKFTCPDCGGAMVLCAGNIMEPYFRHYEEVVCDTRQIRGTQKTLQNRRFIYRLLRQSFPEAEILPKEVLTFEGSEKVTLRPDFLVKQKEGDLAIHYLPADAKLREWEQTHLIYQSVGVEDVWFLHSSRRGIQSYTTFEYLVSKYYSFLLYPDAKQEQVLVWENTDSGYRTKSRIRWECEGEKFRLLPDGRPSVKDMRQVEERLY